PSATASSPLSLHAALPISVPSPVPGRRAGGLNSEQGGNDMKAAILYEPNTPLQIAEVEQQGPRAGEARVRVMATGVCHSDWHIIDRKSTRLNSSHLGISYA